MFLAIFVMLMVPLIISDPLGTFARLLGTVIVVGTVVVVVKRFRLHRESNSVELARAPFEDRQGRDPGGESLWHVSCWFLHLDRRVAAVSSPWSLPLTRSMSPL